MKILLLSVLTSIFTFSALADYPQTSIGVIDINKILSESDAAIMAAEQIEKIAIEIENEIREDDKKIIKEQDILIESQAIMAPEAFEAKRKEYESKVQKYNNERQSKLMKIDELVAVSRNNVLNALKPILEEISNERGITILLDKQFVILNADKMDLSEEILQKLNKEYPKLEVSRD